jgi:hypothetical protein
MMIRPAIVLLVIAVWSSETARGDDERPWRAGVARVNITPELPIWLSGYAARNKAAQDKLDDLWAKALVLEDAEGGRAVLVTMDLIGIDRELSRDVCRRIEERYSLPRAAIALCASHTHSGPVVGTNLAPMYSLDEREATRVKAYTGMLGDKLVDVVGEALENLAPVRLSFGLGKATFAVNRRNNPEADVPRRRQAGGLVGPVDHDVPVLVVHDVDGKLRAIVCGYACHATVLDDYLVSGDWPGAAQNELERRHAGATVLFWVGCGADQNPVPRRSVEYVKQYGRQFADAVDKVLEAPGADASGSLGAPGADASGSLVAAKLDVAYEEIDLPFAALPTRAALESDAVGQPPRSFWARHLLAQWDRDGALPSAYPYPVQVWRLGGELQWVFLGGEVVVDYALRLKTELGAQRTWVAGYANDVMGYIASQRVLAEGGYEGGESRYYYGLPAVWAPEVEQRIVDAVHRLSGRR